MDCFRFYFYCGGVYYMNAMYNLKRLGKFILQIILLLKLCCFVNSTI